MLLHALFLGLVVSVSATGHPRDDAPVPELIATPSNFANATARHSFVNPRSLQPRQLYCETGYHACSDGGCCSNTEYCSSVSGIPGCCPNGRVCNLPPLGPPTCTNTGYFLCPSQEYCCPNGAVCRSDSSNNPDCEWADSSPPPPPTITYDVGTSTDTYTDSTPNTSSYSYSTPSTSSYSYSIATPETTSAYTTPPRPTPTTTPSTNSSSSRSNTFSIFNNAETTSSLLGGNDQLRSSALNITPGYYVTGVIFLLVISGLI